MKSILIIGLIAFAAIVILPRVIAKAVLKKRNARDIKQIEVEIRKLEGELGDKAEKAQELAGEMIEKAKIKRLSELYLRDLDIFRNKR